MIIILFFKNLSKMILTSKTSFNLKHCINPVNYIFLIIRDYYYCTIELWYLKKMYTNVKVYEIVTQ